MVVENSHAATVRPAQPWRQRLKASLHNIPAFCRLHFPAPALPTSKRVYVNLDRTSTTSHPTTDPSTSQSEEARIVSNKVVTTQYSILTFIPKNLYHQFRRVANFFFLVIVILQCIEPFQSMEPVVSALPLMIIVGLTAARDGFEDWKRHEVDQTVNNRETLALHNWRNVTMEHKLANSHHSRHRTQYSRSMSLLDKNGEHHHGHFTALACRSKRALRAGLRTTRRILRCTLAWFRKSFRRIQQPSGEVDEGAVNDNDFKDDNIDEETKPPVIGFKYRFLQEKTDEPCKHPHPAGELYQLSESPPQGDVTQPYWRPRLWQDVCEGDIILLRQNDFIPADLLILSSSEQEPICYVETMNLDGETNLKIRQCVPGLSDLCTPEDCAQRQFWVESEGPTNNLLKYNGTVAFPTKATAIPGSSNQDSGVTSTTESKVSIDLSHLLLRGCILRNTEWVIGLVLFIGNDTKLQMNSGHVPSKRSNIEHKMNKQIAINLVIMCIICAFIALMSRAWESHFQDVDAPFITNDASSSFHSAAYSSFVSFMMSIITFQNLVPVALYLTVEGVKTIQAYFIFKDLELYYHERDVPCMPRSWNLSDDLGQIEYIFSDKTGTLTTNQMDFRKCTIDGQVFEYHSDVNKKTDASEEHLDAGCKDSKQSLHSSDTSHPSASKDLSAHWNHNHAIEILDDNANFVESKDQTGLDECPGKQPRRRSSHNTLVDSSDNFLTSTGLGIVDMSDCSSQDTGRQDHPQTCPPLHERRESSMTVEKRKARPRSSSQATAVLIEPASTDLTATHADFEPHSSKGNPNKPSDPTPPSTLQSGLQDAKDNFLLILSICHTVLVSSVASEHAHKKDSQTERDSSSHHSIKNKAHSSTGTARSSVKGSILKHESVLDTEDSMCFGSFRIPENTDYQAQSPDELALVIAAKGLGYVFLGREVDVILMAHPREAEPRRYKILNVLEFNSTRKRMSVIVKLLPHNPPRGPAVDDHEEGHQKITSDGVHQSQHGQPKHKDEILLLTKGADNIIFERLAPGQEQMVEDTTAHLQDFARDGLRTLCLAYRTLDPDDYNKWSQRYHYASTYVSGGEQDQSSSTTTDSVVKDEKAQNTSSSQQACADSISEIQPVNDTKSATTHENMKDTFSKAKTRQDMLEELAEEMERDLQLLGATGIEDKLQAGVPETIQLLKRAGIKIWVLTGDKMETAISIGVSTGLLSHNHHEMDTVQGSRYAQNNPASKVSLPLSLQRQEGITAAKNPSEEDIDVETGHPSGSSKCSDMELILVRGDYEFEKYPCSKKGSHSSSEKAQWNGEGRNNDISHEKAIADEHPVMAQIRTALESFSTGQPKDQSSLSKDTAEMDKDMKATTASTVNPRSSRFGDFKPWDIYEKWDPTNSTLAKPFQRSVDANKRRLQRAALKPREGRNTALVIDGLALKFALEDPVCKELLLQLACQCTAVICCRVSPLQKAMVVKMVKDAKQVMTLSIGDGANDVSMIQEAHIGIGVAGEEGLQAVMASDYSIGQFRFLARLLLVHGHYAYLRNTSMVMLFIFKNILGIGVLFCFEFLCGFSSVPTFEYSYVLLYNVVLTMFPPLILGIFDRDIGPGVLMTFPELYKVGLLQQEFTHTRFLIYSIEGIFQSIVCFIIPYFTYRYGTVDKSGHVQEMYEMGLALAVTSIAQANIFAAVVSQSFCLYHVIFIWGSVALVFVYSFLYALLPKALSQLNPNYGFTHTVMGSDTFWAVVVLTLVVCNLPRLTARFVRRTWSPKDLDIIQEICQLPHMNPQTLSKAPSTITSTGAAAGTTATARSDATTAQGQRHDVAAQNAGRRACGGIDSGNNYSALGRFVRLDWTWGVIPSSFPKDVAKSGHGAAHQVIHSDDNVSFISSTDTSFAEPRNMKDDSGTSSLGLPGLPQSSTHHTETTAPAHTPGTVRITVPTSHSPSVSLMSPSPSPSPSVPSSIPNKYAASIRSRHSGHVPASPHIVSTLVSVPSPSRGSLDRFRSTEATSHSHRRRTGTTNGNNTTGTNHDDSDNDTETLDQEDRGHGNRSASPTFVTTSPPAQIGVSDPLSSMPPTPILGFGFAQEEGMAHLILGTRFYSQNHSTSS
ncbi:hypothetical protein BGZ94_008458 [Podila epigama]|nr:hypothetical protein BGZ94_008458 [Podila epigama]